METELEKKDYVRKVLDANRFAVLATEGDGQPYACFIAITSSDDLTQLFFATYRNTRKYSNLMHNENVSILFEYRSDINFSQQQATVLTAFGKANELNPAETNVVYNAHLLRHPELESFLLSAHCALFKVKLMRSGSTRN